MGTNKKNIPGIPGRRVGGCRSSVAQQHKSILPLRMPNHQQRCGDAMACISLHPQAPPSLVIIVPPHHCSSCLVVVSRTQYYCKLRTGTSACSCQIALKPPHSPKPVSEGRGNCMQPTTFCFDGQMQLLGRRWICSWPMPR